MAIEDEAQIETFTGNNSTVTAYAIPFTFRDKADLIVTRISATGTRTLQTLGTHYTVTGSNLVTTSAIPATETLEVERDTPLTQDLATSSPAAAYISAVEGRLDRIVMGIQDVEARRSRDDGRSLRVPVGETAAELPTATLRKGEILYFNATTGAIETKTPNEILALSSGAPDGVGIPAGGTTGQALVKTSGTSYDVQWSDASPTAAGVLTALQAMTTAQEKSSRVAINARSRAIGFYDSFEDPVRYPDGSTITHKVTSPKVGNPWYRAINDVDTPYIFGGFLRTLRDGGYYLAGHATPEDITNFSYGFEFVREIVPQNTGGTEATLTITIGSGNLVQEDGSTHNAPGNFHLTISEFGVKQTGLYGSAATISSATAATDLFTAAAAHGLETGDYIALAGAGLATAGITAGNFYAIKVSDTTFKAASTKALALAGTAVDVTTNSTGTMTFERALECVNRVQRSGYHSFIEDANMRLPFQGSNASDNLAFDTPHGLANGDPVFLEGSGLPGGLSTKTKYFVVNTQPLTVQLATTLGGTAIVLSSDGSASQTLVGPRRDATSCVPANRKNLLIFSIRGDYLTIDLVGVGAVTYYWRNLTAIFSGSTTAYGDTVGFYYQSVPPSSGATGYTATFPLANVWIDAPEMEEFHRRKHSGYVSMLAAGSRHKLPGRLDLTNPNEDAICSISQSLGYANVKLLIGSAGRTSLGSSKFRFTGGNAFAEGAYLSLPGFVDSTISQVAIAPASIDAGRSAALSSATTGSEVRLDDWETFMTLQTGDMETHRIYGNLAGAGTKRIRIAHYNAPSTTIFDSNASGTPLNTLAVPFEIVIHRLQTASATHLTWVTMFVNGTVIGPQRTSVNMSMNNQYFSFFITQSVANEIVLESILQTLHRTQRP